MNDTPIELEVRAEVLPADYDNTKKQLENIGTLHSKTKRLSVMYFGTIGARQIDIRVRVTNGKCEVVVKSGISLGSHERVEIAQKIEPDQFLGMVKLFAQLGFTSEIGERETLNYTLPGNITASLVSAGTISYLELEQMSSATDLDHNKERLSNLAQQLKVKLLNSEKEFNALCKRLSEGVDWKFHGTNEDYTKLAAQLQHCVAV